jgi:hypothetical protein
VLANFPEDDFITSQPDRPWGQLTDDEGNIVRDAKGWPVYGSIGELPPIERRILTVPTAAPGKLLPTTILSPGANHVQVFKLTTLLLHRIPQSVLTLKVMRTPGDSVPTTRLVWELKLRSKYQPCWPTLPSRISSSLELVSADNSPCCLQLISEEVR